MKKISTKVISVLLCFAMLASAMVIFSACGKKSSEKKVVIIENGVSEYVMIRPDKVSKEVLNAIIAFHSSITDMSGCTLDINSDWVKSEDEIDPSAKEILVGNTNRPETKEVLETLDHNSWAVVDKGNKIVICASSDALLPLAFDWFVENCVNEKEKTVKITEKLVKTEGFGDGLAISLGGVSSYQVVYPKGNEMLEYYASLIQREAEAAAIISDDKAATQNEIVIGNTNRSDAVTFSGANEYSITTDGAKVYINASNEDVLYYAVNYYIEYGLTVGDTIISSPADYNKSGTLENYYAGKSNSWDVNLPYIEEGIIAPVYNIGTGLADDSKEDTITDSYIHVVSNVQYSAFENYAKRLESFGFKKTHTSKTENNDLWGYRLGAAYAYIHYAPLLKQIRVTWDKSSNCEVSDVEYVEEQTGTTTFYQYSLDYTDAKLNFSGSATNCGMLYIIKLQDNSLIMIDGGDTPQASDKSLRGLTDFLYEITGTNTKESLKIRMWYFTHPDGDHNELSYELINYIKGHGHKAPEIEFIGFNYASARANASYVRGIGAYKMIEFMNKNYPDVNYIKLHTGMVFNIGEVKIETLATVENLVNNKGAINPDYDSNDTCALLRFSFGGKSVLVTGDVGVQPDIEHVKLYSGNFLNSDILTAAHHGYNQITNINKYCAPEYVLVSNSYEFMSTMAIPKFNYYTKLTTEDKVHFAGNYTTALAVSNGKITVTKIPRYDNPTGKLDASIR